MPEEEKMSNNNTVNLQTLVGQVLSTSRPLSIDANDGTVYEARRRNPQPTDIALPQGTQFVAQGIEKGRLLGAIEGLGVVKFHPNHLPESGSQYGMKKAPSPVAIAQQAWGQTTRASGIAAAVAQDPELQALAAKVAAKKKEQEMSKLRESEKARLLAELAALDGNDDNNESSFEAQVEAEMLEQQA